MGPRHLNTGSCMPVAVSPEPSPQLQYLLLGCECFGESKHSAHNCEFLKFTFLPHRKNMQAVGASCMKGSPSGYNLFSFHTFSQDAHFVQFVAK